MKRLIPLVLCLSAAWCIAQVRPKKTPDAVFYGRNDTIYVTGTQEKTLKVIPDTVYAISYTQKNGWWLPNNTIDRDSISGYNEILRFTRPNSNGWRKVEWVNGLGKLHPSRTVNYLVNFTEVDFEYNYSDSLLVDSWNHRFENVAAIEFIPDLANDLAQQCYYDFDYNLLFSALYTATGNKASNANSVTISYRDEKCFPTKVRKGSDNISVIVERDLHGYDSLIRFVNPGGRALPMSYGPKVYQVQRLYNDKGRCTEINLLNYAGIPANSAEGWSTKKMTYDDETGDIASIRAFDKNGCPSPVSPQIFGDANRVKFLCNRQHYLTGWSSYGGADGDGIPDKTVTVMLNDFNEPIEYRAIDRDGKPAPIGTDNVYRRIFTYDRHRNLQTIYEADSCGTRLQSVIYSYDSIGHYCLGMTVIDADGVNKERSFSPQTKTEEPYFCRRFNEFGEFFYSLVPIPSLDDNETDKLFYISVDELDEPEYAYSKDYENIGCIGLKDEAWLDEDYRFVSNRDSLIDILPKYLSLHYKDSIDRLNASADRILDNDFVLAINGRRLNPFWSNQHYTERSIAELTLAGRDSMHLDLFRISSDTHHPHLRHVVIPPGGLAAAGIEYDVAYRTRRQRARIDSVLNSSASAVKLMTGDDLVAKAFADIPAHAICLGIDIAGCPALSWRHGQPADRLENLTKAIGYCIKNYNENFDLTIYYTTDGLTVKSRQGEKGFFNFSDDNRLLLTASADSLLTALSATIAASDTESRLSPLGIADIYLQHGYEDEAYRMAKRLPQTIGDPILAYCYLNGKGTKQSSAKAVKQITRYLKDVATPVDINTPLVESLANDLLAGGLTDHASRLLQTQPDSTSFAVELLRGKLAAKTNMDSVLSHYSNAIVLAMDKDQVMKGLLQIEEFLDSVKSRGYYVYGQDLDYIAYRGQESTVLMTINEASQYFWTHLADKGSALAAAYAYLLNDFYMGDFKRNYRYALKAASHGYIYPIVEIADKCARQQKYNEAAGVYALVNKYFDNVFDAAWNIGLLFSDPLAGELYNPDVAEQAFTIAVSHLPWVINQYVDVILDKVEANAALLSQMPHIDRILQTALCGLIETESEPESIERLQQIAAEMGVVLTVGDNTYMGEHITIARKQLNDVLDPYIDIALEYLDIDMFELLEFLPYGQPF